VRSKLLLLLVAAANVALVVIGVDLTPRVESDFFFSTDDPQLVTSRRIEERFPSSPQLFLRAAGEVRSEAYVEEIGALTSQLQELPGVASVQSLTSGPRAPLLAFTSPFWSRLLIAETPAGDDGKGSGDGEEGPPPATNLVVLLRDGAPEGDAAAAGSESAERAQPPPPVGATVRAVEAVVAAAKAGDEAAVDGTAAAGAAAITSVEMSGVPYVVELVSRYLLRDLKVFSAAAILLFALMVGLLFRSAWVVVGTLATCLLSCAVTLALLSLMAVPIGVLTANLVTIVFVLTLSHLVFLTSNWRRLAAEAGAGPDILSPDVTVPAMRLTFEASFWSMATTLLGFLSLLFASAKPMRELGISGAVGALVAIACAYLFYPPFLRGLQPSAPAPPPATGVVDGATGPVRGAVRLALVVIAVCLVAGTGVVFLSTDPGLLSFFERGSELRKGLEAIDRDGGSSPLSMVVADPSGVRLDTAAGMAKIDALQGALEADPATGVVLSVSPLLAEARQAAPIAAFLPPQGLLDLLSGDAFQNVARSFVTADRTEAILFLRMREAGRVEPRQAVIDRLTAAVREADLEPVLVGGLYELQGKLASLVAGSLATGLTGLLVLFVLIAARVSRTARATAAMVAGLILIPLFLLGAMGWLRLPLDIISSPAANIAIALGVDSMIHLAAAARRARARGLEPAAAWIAARGEMVRPVLGATLVVAVGFGIFALSSFPPTQRFGMAVVLGTLAAAAVTLGVLPVAAGWCRTVGG
jgi:predicted RND superfamily exporter protein